MRQTQKPRIVNLLMLTVAGMINAFGITLFMTRSNYMTVVFRELLCCLNR